MNADFEMLFILACAFNLVENEVQMDSIIQDMRSEVASLQAQGIAKDPPYATEIFDTWGDCFPAHL